MYKGLNRFDSVIGVERGKDVKVIRGILVGCEKTGSIKELRYFTIMSGTKLYKGEYPHRTRWSDNGIGEVGVTARTVIPARDVLFEKHIVPPEASWQDDLTPAHLRKEEEDY